MKHNLSSVTPVWGDYYKFLPQLIDNLKQVKIPEKNIYIITPNLDKVKKEIPNKTYKEINVVSYDSTNVSQLRNYALEYITTPYVCFADADDTAVLQGFELIYQTIINNPELSLVTGQIQYPNKSLYPWPKQYFIKAPRLIKQIIQPAFNNIPFANGTITKTQTIKELQGFPDWEPCLAEDGAIATLLILNHKVQFLPIVSRAYNVHDQGLCQKGHNFYTWFKQYKKLRQYLMTHPQTPLVWKRIIPFYVPIHLYYSIYLAQYANHTK